MNVTSICQEERVYLELPPQMPLNFLLQCYVYELAHEGSKETVQCLRGAKPFAIVTFSYTDTKETVAASLKER